MPATVLAVLARNCPYLQKVHIFCKEVTVETILVLPRHCRQLRVLGFTAVAITLMEMVNIILHSAQLTELYVNTNEHIETDIIEHCKSFSSKGIRALREFNSRRAEVITHRNSGNSTCLIL